MIFRILFRNGDKEPSVLTWRYMGTIGVDVVDSAGASKIQVALKPNQWSLPSFGFQASEQNSKPKNMYGYLSIPSCVFLSVPISKFLPLHAKP